MADTLFSITCVKCGRTFVRSKAELTRRATQIFGKLPTKKEWAKFDPACQMCSLCAESVGLPSLIVVTEQESHE